jgi:alpha-methylacyl-CoA racemase
MGGPLSGLRIIEFAGLGPGPFAGMMLADHGAEVIRIERKGSTGGGDGVLERSRRSIALDLKSPEARDIAARLCAGADAVVEGFRPGVMERLGLGPDDLRSGNPALVYGRMTGWGQTGPMSQDAGHDINYISISGALHAIGRKGEKPAVPLNLVGDFGGGGMLLAFGLLAAILNARSTGQGQVVDCSMLDGSALLMASFWGLRAKGHWQDTRGVNILDSGAHFYDVYETQDGKEIAVGAIEPKFYANLLRGVGLEGDADFARQMDNQQWPALKERLAAIFLTRTRDEWAALLANEACVTPVLAFDEIARYPQNEAREIMIEVEGLTQPAPAPRYSQTPLERPRSPVPEGHDTETLLRELGLSESDVAALRSARVID